MTTPQWLLDIQRKVEENQKTAAQRHIEWQKAEEQKAKEYTERITAQITKQNNDYICRAFGVTKAWCRENGINM